MILTKNGNLMKFASGAAVNAHIVDPYNPLGLPPFTIRCFFTGGYTPTSIGDSQTLVEQVAFDKSIWDITKNSTNWSSLFASNKYLRSVLGANTKGVTNMASMFFNHTQTELDVALFDTSSVINFRSMFSQCYYLYNIPLYDTSSGENMSYMFSYCTALTHLPLINTSSCKYAYGMCQYCNKVESGALALYQQMSTQVNPPTNHTDTFYYCGHDTVTGAAELAQIPTSWGGTAS